CEEPMSAMEMWTVSGTMAVQQRRILSVLVVDIRDFTVLSRQLGEQKLAELICCFSRAAGEAIRQCAGRLDKYIGDAVMAVWFHDEDGLDDSHMLRPLEAARAIHRAITK